MPRELRAFSAPQSSALRLQGGRCFLIGIGGCGMSGLARLFRARGAVVQGSDSTPSPVTDALRADDIAVSFDQSAAIPEGVDLVIASAAIRPEHPQLLAAQNAGIPTLTYAEALGRLMQGRTGVAVAGTHGKSTTVAMLAHALIRAGLDPDVIVGATTPHLSDDATDSRGWRVGAPEIPKGRLAGAAGLLLAEACEFNRSFHNLRPTIASVSAVEADHLDIYGSLDAVVEAFHDFAALLPAAEEGGRLLIAHDGAHRREVAAGIDAAVETIGYGPDADWAILLEGTHVELRTPEGATIRWRQPLPGAHNAANAAVAAALASMLGADHDAVAEALSTFKGVDRRTQLLGERRGVRIYDDYGHHPTEIDATLRALRAHEHPKRLVCVFQPHQHSRTRFLLEEFAQSFSQADVVIVPHIYFVRDSEIEKTRVSAADLVDRLRDRGVNAMHLYPFDAIVDQLDALCREGDLLVVMGAGPVWQVAHSFLRRPAASTSDAA